MLLKAILGGRYMKRIIAVALILSLLLTVLTGCNGSEEQEIDDEAVKAAILEEFNNITQIPRTTGHERAISTYLRTWAKDNGLDVVRDSSNNVIMDKPATPGYEKAPTTILQSNMDMALTVKDGVEFDPISTPVKIISQEDTLTGDGTSLGASSGIGMSTALYVLKYAQKHGPIRVIFTTDGEEGMSGAKKLKTKYLEGDYLINLGWNQEDTINTGSGGSASYEMIRKIEWTQPQNTLPYLITLSGLHGGPASKEIGNGSPNAIKIIGDILAKAQGQGILFELASFNGGVSAETIPEAAAALIVINESDQKKMQSIIDDAMDAFKGAYGGIEDGYSFTYAAAEMPDKVISFDDNGSIISFIYGIINGVQSMSKTYDDVVESATNIGLVSTASGNFACRVSAGSTSDVGLYEITTAHEAISSMCSMEYNVSEGIPRWPDHSKSKLFADISQAYSLYGGKPNAIITHQGSECGWFVKKNPKLQVISIGPEIENPDLPEEILKLKTVTLPAKTILKFLEQQKDLPAEIQ
ncbi:aminoacyl-histidine dipeptidase [Anoxybacterium hadale]|uniref:Aminoacyl-histidine dipeptidase n=1 Tax=Anoxybacterium hadale TaxID=3408580 RepID=A0ACD1A8R7_9FIRM|nr:aminoacyl-histidine dipeptidase [Clostridiales bacterium]